MRSIPICPAASARGIVCGWGHCPGPTSAADPASLSGAQQALQVGADRIGLDEESVVSELAGQHDRLVVDEVRHAACDALLPSDWEEPVAVAAEHARPGRDGVQRLFEAAPVAAEVVRGHGLDDGDVAVRIESAGELVAVEVEVRLDGETSAAAER